MCAPLAISPWGFGQRGFFAYRRLGAQMVQTQKKPLRPNHRGEMARGADILDIVSSKNIDSKIKTNILTKLLIRFNFLTALELKMTPLKRSSVEKLNLFIEELGRILVISKSFTLKYFR